MARRAVVIGSNGPPSDPLRYAAGDAVRFGRALSEHCGFQVDTIAEGTDAQDIDRIIARSAAGLVPDDTFVIYFSGHGEVRQGLLFLLLGDTTHSLFDSALGAHRLLECLKFSPAGQKLLVLDCCRAGKAVGFKGGEPLREVVHDGSELVLCASDHLEKARELDELEGGFMTTRICEILEAPSPAVLNLTELLEVLQRKADEHNTANPARSVPRPYLFGAQRSPFLIKRPAGALPVTVKFSGLHDLDSRQLSNSLKPYVRWAVTDRVPVTVIFPPVLEARAAELRAYVETGQWPKDTHPDAMDGLGDTARNVERVREGIATAIRALLAAGARPDKSDISIGAKACMEGYIRAQCAALARVLSSSWLQVEDDQPWRDQMRELDTVYDPRTIFGLTLVHGTDATFWANADWDVGDRQVRIYVPQVFGWGEAELTGLGDDVFYRYLVPQLIDPSSSGLRWRGDLYAALARPVAPQIANITVRGESLVEMESHNVPDGNSGTKERTTRSVAEQLKVRFDVLPPAGRRDFAFKVLVRHNILPGLHEKLREIAPAIDAALHGE